MIKYNVIKYLKTNISIKIDNKNLLHYLGNQLITKPKTQSTSRKYICCNIMHNVSIYQKLNQTIDLKIIRNIQALNSSELLDKFMLTFNCQKTDQKQVCQVRAQKLILITFTLKSHIL